MPNTHTNGWRAGQLFLGLLALLLTILATIFTDRLVMARNQAVDQEKISTLERKTDRITEEYVRKDWLDVRLQAVEGQLNRLEAAQIEMNKLLQRRKGER
jgi:uncharacterized membrane protein (DUF106 family)